MQREETVQGNKQGEDMKVAIELLEKAYHMVHSGCSFYDGKLKLVTNTALQYQIAKFVQSVKPETDLKLPISLPNSTQVC